MSKLIVCLALCLAMISPCSLVHAKMVTVDAMGTYLVGDGPDEKIAVAKARAREEAMRIATEKVGVYVESYSKTHNSMLTYDEVKVIAAQILKITEEKIVPTTTQDNHIMFKCFITATVDDEAIEIKKILSNRDTVEKTIELEKRIQELQRENIELKKRYKNSSSDSERKFAIALVQKNEVEFVKAFYSLPVYTQGEWHSGIDVDSINYDKVAGIITYTSTEDNKLRGTKNVTKAKIYVNENKFIYLGVVHYPANGGKPDILKGGTSCALEPIEPDSYIEKYQKKLYEYLGVTNAPINRTPNWIYATELDFEDGSYQKYYIDINNIRYNYGDMTVHAYVKCHSSKYGDSTSTYVFDLKNHRVGGFMREVGKIIMETNPQPYQWQLYQKAKNLYNESIKRK